MEMAITASFPGNVVQVFVRSNFQVDLEAPLIHIEPSEWVDTLAETELVQFVDATYTAETNEDTPQVRCRRIFEVLRCQMLGYDSDPSDSRRLLKEQSAVYQLIAAKDQVLLQVENELLSIFADICLLFRRELDPIEANELADTVHTSQT